MKNFRLIKWYYFIFLCFVATGLDARVLTVGPNGEFVFPSIAAQFAQNGDTIEIDANGVYLNDFVEWKQNNLTIRGVNGRPHIRGTVKIPNRKAIWIIKGHNTTVENVEISGARVGDKNGAAFRLEGLNFFLSDCYIHDNQNGILAGKHKPKSEIYIKNCEFAFNGKGGKGRTHNIYIGTVGKFTLENSYSHNAIVGHLVKSRAKENYILNNRLFEGAASYAVDLPNGGYSVIMGNIMLQNEQTDNSAIIAYGMEQRSYSNNRLIVQFNSIQNDRNYGIFVKTKVKAEVILVNNIFSGKGKVFEGRSRSRKISNNFVGQNAFAIFQSDNISVSPKVVDSLVDSSVLQITPQILLPSPNKQISSGGVIVDRKPLGKAFDIGATEIK